MKRLNKKTGIAIFTAVMAILAVIILVYHNPLANPQDELLKKVIACVLIVAAVIAFIRLYDKITVLPVELYQNRRLIWKLAKSDFKKRYAGSYMGAFWAMVQPVITVAMYWVVFVIIFPNRTGYASGGVEGVPYILFLTAGLVPWFYFSEALTSAMVSLLEYGKKSRIQNQYPADYQDYCSDIYSCVFRAGFTDRGSIERLLSEPVYTAGILLQLLHVRFCTGTQLYDLLGCHLFQGSAVHCQYLSAGRYVGNSGAVEYQ